jgi:hypothetical protein
MSTKRRRAAGAALTSIRSSGTNNTTLKTPNAPATPRMGLASRMIFRRTPPAAGAAAAPSDAVTAQPASRAPRGLSGLPDHQLRFDRPLQRATLGLHRDLGHLAASLHQIERARGAKRSKRREVEEGLDHVGLTLPIVTEKHAHPCGGIQGQMKGSEVPPPDRTEAAKPQVGCRGPSPRTR